MINEMDHNRALRVFPNYFVLLTEESRKECLKRIIDNKDNILKVYDYKGNFFEIYDTMSLENQSREIGYIRNMIRKLYLEGHKESIIDSIIRTYGTRNLSRCSECHNRTLEIRQDSNYSDGHYTTYECHFCGYLYKTTWSNPNHGIYYEIEKLESLKKLKE